MTSNLFNSGELATYFQNNLRTDVLKLSSPMGPGVPMTPIASYQIVPSVAAEGNVNALRTNNGGNAPAIQGMPEGNIPLNTASLDYFPATDGLPAYIQLDCLRCIEIELGPRDVANTYFLGQNSAAGTIANPLQFPTVTIVGADERGRDVSEIVRFGYTPGQPFVANPNPGVPPVTLNLISNKAYYRIYSITISAGTGRAVNTLTLNSHVTAHYEANVVSPVTLNNAFGFSVKASNKSFGLPYYAWNPNVTFDIVALHNNDISKNIEATITPALNFRSHQPNGRATTYEDSIGGSPGSVTQGDARGVMTFGSAVNGNTIIRCSMYVQGADSEMAAKISQPLINGYVGTQRAFQKAISGVDFNAANSVTAPTELTPFDVYGVQYPGDLEIYERFLNTLTGAKPLEAPAP